MSPRTLRTLLAAVALVLPAALHAQLGIAIGATAPDVMVETLDGRPVSLASTYKGRPAVIEFWATWCGN